jgi:glycolate oxidase
MSDSTHNSLSKTGARPGFVDRLRSICPRVIEDEERLAVYETDGLTAKKQVPWLVVLPDTVAQVQSIIRLCHDEAVPLVARGAGTGLSGGAMPHAEGVLLVMARFNRILDVDECGMTAVVEPGVTNLGISDAVSDLGLYYAPDPSSQIACTIGGNVAENSGGVHCLKYGLTVHNVIGLKLVLPSGELIELGGDLPDSPGFDLLSLMHGSEGMLGIVVEVTVRLLAKPASVIVMMAAFEQISDAADSVSAVIGAGILPSGLEMMDRLAIEAAEAFVGAGYPVDAGAVLLCELDGLPDETARLAERVSEIFRQRRVIEISIATAEADRARLWQGRKAAFPAVGRLAPDYYCMDGTIPRRELADVLTTISRLSEKHRLPVANVFHAGDGNLHPLILYDANDSDQLARAEAFGSEILTLCIEKGGTITGEHGVGVEKINEMCLQFSELELGLFHGVKAAFDEKGFLNPGKAVPTLSRCAEFGAMHVHNGDEKFSDLERF